MRVKVVEEGEEGAIRPPWASQSMNALLIALASRDCRPIHFLS